MLDDKKGVFKTGLIGALIATLASSANVFVARQREREEESAHVAQDAGSEAVQTGMESSGSNVSRSRVLEYIHPNTY